MNHYKPTGLAVKNLTCKIPRTTKFLSLSILSNFFLRILLALLISSFCPACILLQKKEKAPILPDFDLHYFVSTGQSKPIGWAHRLLEEVERDLYSGYRYYFELVFQFKQEGGHPMYAKIMEESFVDMAFKLREFRFASTLNDEMRTTEGILSEKKIKLRINQTEHQEHSIAYLPHGKIYGDYIMCHPKIMEANSLQFDYYDTNRLRMETRIITYLDEVVYETNGQQLLLKKFLVEERKNQSLYFYFFDTFNRLFTTNILGNELLIKLTDPYEVYRLFQDG